MNILMYVLVCAPTVLMIIAGLAVSSVRRDSAMVNHHHARNFNINRHSKKTIIIFSVTGILFSVSGAVLMNNFLIPGIIIMFITLLGFIISFATLNK